MVSKGFILLLLTLFSFSCAFYIPGISPKNYIRGAEVDLKYNKIYSDKTQLPFEYISLPVCKPKTNKHVIENLGEILRGDRIIISNFEINMLVDVDCKVLCDPIHVDKKSSERLSRLIKDDYKVEWIIDGLPSSTVLRETDSSRKQYEQGFNLGFHDKQTDKSYLFNHFNIRILYNRQPEEFDGVRIVGFEVFPVSISSQGRTGCAGTIPKDAAPQMVGEETTLLYTYSVSFLEEPNLAWSSRWDLFLSNSNPHIHWYSIINSLIILLFLSAMVAIIMLRTLNNDISTYNSDLKEEQEDVTGWKLVHGDVFRPPKQGNLLASILGSGIQFIGMVSSTVVLSLFGILNPSYRGGMLSFAIFLFAFMGIFGGYYSARMYKVFKGSSWQKNALLTGTLFPGFLFAIFFILNLFIWSQGSSSAIPFGTFVALVTLWFCISLPLVFLGAYFGQKKQVIEHPVRNNQIPRAIPDTSLFLHPVVSVLIGGLLPFAVVFIELFFIMKSVWQDQFYYMFGFLAIVTVMLVLSCVEITIVIIYFQLCSEDYHWWWRSFLISASSTIYIFIYGTYYYVRRLEIVAFVPGLIYFTYMIMASIVYFLCTGTIGFFACYYALRKIYSAVKIE